MIFYIIYTLHKDKGYPVFVENDLLFHSFLTGMGTAYFDVLLFLAC